MVKNEVYSTHRGHTVNGKVTFYNTLVGSCRGLFEAGLLSLSIILAQDSRPPG
jgi:hypothetical protein